MPETTNRKMQCCCICEKELKSMKYSDMCEDIECICAERDAYRAAEKELQEQAEKDNYKDYYGIGHDREFVYIGE